MKYRIIERIRLFIGMRVTTGVCLPQQMERLIPLCKNFALTGTKKQAKQAIRCLYVNVFRQNENIFNDIIEVSTNNYSVHISFTATAEITCAFRLNVAESENKFNSRISVLFSFDCHPRPYSAECSAKIYGVDQKSYI